MNNAVERTADASNSAINTHSIAEFVSNPDRVKPFGIALAHSAIEPNLSEEASILKRADHAEWGPGKISSAMAI
eukprot:2612521-Amphidinium_carterae.1